MVRNASGECAKGAIAHSFSSLFEKDIHPSVVFSTFQSGIEQADRYGMYFFRQQMNDSSGIVNDDLICNCSSVERAFGRYCEYEFYAGSTLDDIIRLTKIKDTTDFVYGQLQRRRVCYTSIDCDYGLLCLDWREICNGAQNCMDGNDEENCDQIEMNECAENEYRCQNGLCIPEEYWLDGEFDCQDASDEVYQTSLEKSCPNEKGIECDEHLCQVSQQLPCGDGQCSVAFMSAKSLSASLGVTAMFECGTLRDLAFYCELYEPFPLWTLANGFCMWSRAPWSTTNTTIESECEFYLKCQFSRRLSTNCPDNDQLSILMKNKCQSELDWIQYPPGALLSPRTYSFYKPGAPLRAGFYPDYVLANGELRCAGFHLTTNEYELPNSIDFINSKLFSYDVEEFLCHTAENSVNESKLIRNYSAFANHFDLSCWNRWLPLFQLSNAAEVARSCAHTCLSPYRIHDGSVECSYNNFDETSIVLPVERSKKHCLNCMTQEQQSICLSIHKIHFSLPKCTQGEDMFIIGSQVAIKDLTCTNRDTSGCHIIRHHIGQSSLGMNENRTVLTSNENHFQVLPFGQYCDTFFDTETNIDESIDHCLSKWTCARNEYRCKTGQCIPSEWLCDGEWDCSDASDEQRLFLQINDFDDDHNKQVFNFNEVMGRCFEQHSQQAFSNICNITLEYPCLLAHVDEPLNFTLNRPCIKLEQIGDKHVDCLGKIDEHNLLKCGSDVLGWSFGCTDSDNICVSYMGFCVDLMSPCSRRDRQIACFYKNDLYCNSAGDALCFDGTCQPNARCDRKWDCSNGEDEYWCCFNSFSSCSIEVYRYSRRIAHQQRVTLTIYMAKSKNQINQMVQKPPVIDSVEQILTKFNTHKRSKTSDSISNDDAMIDGFLIDIRRDLKLMLKTELPFICNRGIPIKNNDGNTQCLCPPSHYGDYCEFQADRISVVTHVNLTRSNGNHPINQNSSILVSCTFLHVDEIIDRYEFHIQSITQRMKQKFYFVYPRTKEVQDQKRTLRNGTRLYSIRFEAFYLQRMIYPTLLGVWHFPIEFDFLPAVRFGKILHFNATNQNQSCNFNCGSHGKCIRLENDLNQFVCHCESGWYGHRCDQYDNQCENFCHPNGLCRPEERGMINGDHRPVCLCPYGWFGPTCHLSYGECQECLNGGSCYLTYDRSHVRPFECICTDDFYGDHCQFARQSVFLRFNDSFSRILSTSLQYYDVDDDLFDLNLREQQVYLGRPLQSEMKYDEDNAPSMIIVKSYTEHHQQHGPLFHLVYSREDPKALINMTVQLTSENECAHTQTLFHSKIVESMSEDVLVFKYHELCHSEGENDSSRVCFRDDRYFCLCDMKMERAQCLRFDPSSDKCDKCLSGGKCVRGNIKKDEDFVCLCRRCLSGSVCQYSSELFSFTLDSLIIKDVESKRDLSIGIYVSIISLSLLFGIFNNICSLFVFSRRNPRQVGVGNYLFLVSLINIISLVLLFVKILHILLGSAGFLMNNQINLICCKFFSSLLSITVRVNYWLISLITIERLCAVIFPTRTTIKKPKVAFVLSLITILILCGMHVHEFLYYIMINANPQEINSTSILCVTNFEHQTVSIYNSINVLIHHLVPFLIQIISITLLIVWAAKSRARATSNRENGFSEILRKQFRTQKELYLTPGVIIIAALPQLIFTFSFVCSELHSAWQRYGLLIAYLFSFIPQLFGFIIFVLPSSSYKTEFQKTKMGQLLLRVCKHTRP